MSPKWKKIILCSFALPLVAFIILRPEWLARLVAITIFSIIIPIAILVFGLTIKVKIEGNKGFFSKPRPERTRRNMEFFWRGLIVMFGLFILYVITIPILYDAFQFSRQGEPYLKQIKGRVTNNSSPFGMYFLSQGLKIEIKKGEPNENCDAIFLPRHANLGQTYTFQVAPKSGIVLNFTETPSDE